MTINPDATSLPKVFRSSVRPNAIAFDARGVVVERSTPNSIFHLKEMAERITIAGVENGRGRSERQRLEAGSVGAMEGSEKGG